MPPRASLIAILLLAAAWGASLYSGTVLTGEMREIRTEYKESLGGYHLAPDDDPRRAEFRKLHGMAMMLAMGELLLGLSALFLITQSAPNADAGFSVSPGASATIGRG